MIALLLACQQPDFSEEWELDRLRLLAIRAEPAEPRPGDVVQFSALRYVPDGAEWSALWIACVAGSEQGCSFDPALLERLETIDQLSQQELMQLIADLQAAGLIGIQPGFDPVWPVPEDALAGLSDAEAVEGLSATIQVNLGTEADQELVLKSIPVSLAATPNHNPDVVGMLVGQVPHSGAPVRVQGGRPIDLVATASPLESYQYTTTDGRVEERSESYSWRWYINGGELGTDLGVPTLPDAEEGVLSIFTWTPPKEPGSYEVDVVVLDGRGGMGWRTVDFEVE